MRRKVAFGITEVCPIKPHIGLIRNSIERQPAALSIRYWVGVDSGAISEWTIRRNWWIDICPVTWNLDLTPFGLVEAGADRPRSMFVANLCGVPDSIE